ncbi:MAG: hypothetical protein Q9163_002430, partial [Psora crenata]
MARFSAENVPGIREAEDEKKERGDEEKARQVSDFEKTMIGLEDKGRKPSHQGNKEATDPREGSGVKRKREMDEDEMLKIAREERAKARKAIDEEKAAEAKLPSFWVPSLTPVRKKESPASCAPPKLNPLCPSSSPANKHSISLKTLVTINFKLAPNSSSPSVPPTFICPACDKVLSNTIKAVMAIPCGHVLCKPCAGKFMSQDTGPRDPHDGFKKESTASKIICYVCSADVTPSEGNLSDGKKKSKQAEKAEVKPGLIELRSDGTGFAGGGDNM